MTSLNILKQRANALISVLENYSKVLKMESEYANSAGSAMKENEVYLTSWEAKAERLSNTWVEFVAKTANADMFKNLLDSGTKTLEFFDTLGNVLPVIAGILLTLKADSLSKTLSSVFGSFDKIKDGFTVLGTVISNLKTNIRNYATSQGIANTQMEIGSTAAKGLSLSLNSILGIAGLLITGFSLIKNAVDNNARAMSEAREKNIEYAKSTTEYFTKTMSLSGEYDSLIKKTNRTTEENSRLRDIEKELIPLLGEKKSALDKLTVGTNEYADAISNASRESAKSKLADIRSGLLDAEKELENSVKSGIFKTDTKSIYLGYSKELAIFDRYIEKYKKQVSQYSPLDIKISAPKDSDEIIQFYSDLTQAVSEYKEQANKYLLSGDSKTADKMLQSESYKNIILLLDEIKPKIQDVVKLKFAESLSNGIPKSQEDLEKLISTALKGTNTYEAFGNEAKELAFSIFPNLADSIIQVGDSSDYANSETQELNDTIKQLPLSFEEFNNSISLIESGLKSGITESSEFREALKAVFGDALPDDLNSALETVKLLFDNGTDSAVNMFDILSRYSDESSISFTKLQEDLMLSDSAMATLINRLNEMGVMLPTIASWDTIGNGLGLMAEESLKLESELKNLYSAFNDGIISREALENELDSIIEKFGITSEAAADLRRNWKYQLDGLSEETLISFTGVGGAVADELQTLAENSIDKFKKALSLEASDALIGDLRLSGLVDATDLQNDIAEKLKETEDFTQAQIDSISNVISENVFAIKLQTTVETIVDQVAIPESEKKNVEQEVLNQFNSETKQFDIKTALEAVIERVGVSDDEKAKVKSAIQESLSEDGTIDISLLNTNLNGLGDGVSKKLLPIAEGLQNINKITFDEIQKEEESLKTQLENSKKEAEDLKKQLDNVDSATTAKVRAEYDSLIRKIDELVKKASSLKSLVIPNVTSYVSDSSKSTYKAPKNVMANASGSINNRRSGDSIVGEEGAELRISKDGKSEIIGKNGPEIIQVEKGDTILPADVTERVLRGEIPMYASGRIPKNYPTSSSSSKSTSSAVSNSKSTSSTKSSSDAEESKITKVDLDNLVLYEKKYKELKNDLEKIIKLKDDLSKSTEEQIELANKEIEIYRQQQNIQHLMNEERRSQVQDIISKLSKNGIEIEFNPELNELEFIQSIEEIENKINSIDLGDTDKTNELREKLEKYITEIIQLNEANIESSNTWAELREEIYKTNLAIANIDYSDFMNNTKKSIDNLEYLIDLISDNELNFFDKKLELLNSQLEAQKSIVEKDNQQLKILQQLFIEGKISSSQFKEETDKLYKSMQEGTAACKKYAEAINSLKLEQLNKQKEAVFDIVDLTKELIKQEADDQIKALEGIADGYKKQKDLLDDIIDGLEKELKKEKKIADNKKKAIDDDLKAYKEKIDLQKKLLDGLKEERSYKQGLDEKNKDITKIQDRLTELEGNDSLSAKNERNKLLEELAEKQLDLDNYVFDNKIQREKDALDSEYERYAANKDKEAELIERNFEIFENSLNARIDGLKLEKDQYDEMAENIKTQVEEIQANIQKNGELTRMAMDEIDKRGEQLYQDLLEWNRIYGTGIDEDIAGSWENYLRVVEKGNATTLEYTRQIMRDILDLSQQISMANANMSTQTIGIRSYFEGTGHTVDWNDKTKQFSIDGNYFDSASYENKDSRLYATYEELLELEKQLAKLPKFDTGGRIKASGFSIIHADEQVLTAKQTLIYDQGIPMLLEGQEILNTAIEDLHKSLNISSNKLDSSNLNSALPEINISSSFNIDGIATDEIARNLKRDIEINNIQLAKEISSQIRNTGTPLVRAY